MKFIRIKIPDVVIIEPVVHADARGYVVETYRKDKLEAFLGFGVDFCQDNESKSSKGVLGGLHCQMPPFSQIKLVCAITGKVLDVAVDIRKGSPTFGQYVTVEFSDENKRQLFVPRGFIHGFVVLSNEVTFAHKVDNYYAPECDRGIAFDDPIISIDWQLPKEMLQFSDKDRKQLLLKDAQFFDYNEALYG